MRTRSLIILPILLCMGLSAAAQEEAFEYTQELAKASDVWHRIALPDALYSRVRSDKGDIRIQGLNADGQHIEAPYLIELIADKKVEHLLPFDMINEARADGGRYYTLALKGEDLKTIDRIELNLGARSFDTRVRLEGSFDQQAWFGILENYRILALDNPTAQYRFTRLDLPPSQYGFYRLYIPGPDDLDLRQVSIKQQADSKVKLKTYTHRIIDERHDAKTNTSTYDLKLAIPVPLSSITWSVDVMYDYYRPITLSYPADSLKTDKGWQYRYETLKRATMSSLEPGELRYQQVLTDRLRIEIDQGDNPPVMLQSIQLAGNRYELVARFTEPGTYALAYGNEKVNAPRYDLSAFSNRIPEGLSYLTLGSVEMHELPIAPGDEPLTPLFEDERYLWGIMVLIILLLGGFTWKMMMGKK